MVPGFIDPPSPAAPLSEWEAFLRELKGVPHEGHAIWRKSVQQAERMIVKKRAALENQEP